MVEKTTQGKRVGDPVPYGYVLNADGTTAIREPQASVVRRIFAERQAGRTIAAIAEGFNVDGVPGPTGGRWVVSRVYGITTNPYYAGQVRFNARSTRATITTAAVDHPALVDEATFRRVSGAKVA
jgi:site-specific DNA recombinase